MSTKKMRKQVFLQAMEQAVSWTTLYELIASYYNEGLKGRWPFAMQAMLQLHFI